MGPEQPALDEQMDDRHATRRTRLARRRGGFTLLEILVVIGIILLLVAIGVIAFGALDQSGKVTKTTLSNLQSMLAEFQAQTNLRDQPPFVWRAGTKAPTGATGPTGAPGASLWRDPAVIGTDAKHDGNVASGQPARYTWSAVANTQMVYQFLNRFPSNKQLMTKLPSKQVLGTIGQGDVRGDLTGVERVIDPPLVLDAWSNPIVFVGSDGLAGVRYEAKKQGDGPPKPQRVTTAGIYDLKGSAYDTDGLPKSRRPFFASAGPDGDFKTGDDNVYSFEQ